MNIVYFLIYGLFFCSLTVISPLLYAHSNIVITGVTMSYDTASDITTTEGGDGVATAVLTTKDISKKLEAKTIRTKMNGAKDTKASTTNHTFNNDIEWVEAIGQVNVSFPDRTMTAERCIMQNKKIHCYGTVTIIAGKNSVKGDEGTFDLEHDRYEIFASKGGTHHVEATIHPEKASIIKDSCE